MKRRSRFLLFSLLALIAAIGGGRMWAQTTIAVTNFDFETGGLADGLFSSGPGVIPSGWSATTGGISGTFFGYYNPNSSGYTGTTGSSTTGTMSGPNIFYFGSAVTNEGLQQTVAANFTASTNYTLTVAVGTRAGNLASTAELALQLLAGSTVIASTTVRNGTADSFADFALTFDAVSAGSTYNSVLGQAITIRLVEIDTSFSGEMDIDNVRLTATAIPESGATTVIAGLAALGTAWGLRRRRGRKN